MENKSWRSETPWMKAKDNIKDKSGAVHTPMSRARDLARKAIKQKEVKEAMSKADQPAYLRKQKGEKLTLADVKAPRKDSISSKEALAKARGEDVKEALKVPMPSALTPVKHNAGSSGPHRVNKPGHPEHGKIVHVVGTAKDIVGTRMVRHSDGNSSMIRPDHLTPVKQDVKEANSADVEHARNAAELARLKAEKRKHDAEYAKHDAEHAKHAADSKEHKERASNAYYHAYNKVERDRSHTFKQSPSWEYGVRANKQHEKNQDVRRHLDIKRGEAHIQAKQEFSKLINKTLSKKLHNEEYELGEGHKVGDEVYIHRAFDRNIVGKTGRITAIKHGNSKGDRKTYTVDHGNGTADLKAGKEYNFLPTSGKMMSRFRTTKEDVEYVEEARGRPRKNPAPAKAKGDDEDDYGPDKGPEPDQNIHQQLKRAADAKHDEVKGKEGYKTKGGAHVTFASGEKHFVHADHAHKVLSALDKLKPADRSKMHDHIYQSHSNFQAVHKLVG